MAETPLEATKYLIALMDIHQLRSLRMSTLNDLDIAIEKAIELMRLEAHKDLMLFCSTLGKLYARRFLRNQKSHRRDLDEGRRLTRAAAEEVEAVTNEFKRALYEHELYRNHAWLLYLSFLEDKSVATLDESIRFYGQTINTIRGNVKWASSSEHYVSWERYGPYYLELGIALTTRSICGGSTTKNDIGRALDALERADSPLKTRSDTEQVEVYMARRDVEIIEWAQRLHSSPEQTLQLADRLATYGRDSWKRQGAGLNARIGMAQFASELWALMGVDDKALELCDSATRTLPALSTWAMSMKDRQYIVANHSRLSLLSASLALRAGRTPYQALSMLEMGRGIISGQVLDIRADFSELQQKLPNLASRFETLRNELDDLANLSVGLQRGSSAVLDLEARTQRQQTCERKFNELLRTIRMTNGFESFLMAPSEDEIRAAARSGPVVVLTSSSLRADAIIIQPEGVRAIELPDTSNADIEDMGSEIKRYVASSIFDINPLLCRMWETIARPVMEALGLYKPPSGSVWPRMYWVLAGAFSHLPLHAAGDHRSGCGDSVIDRVVSSYAPTVKTLVHWHRRKSTTKLTVTAGFHQALLVGMPLTPGQKPLPAVKEEVLMLEKLLPSLGLQIKQPSQKRKDDVIESLKLCKMFHFAGHVVSTMWEVSDSPCVDVAREFYKSLLETEMANDAVALALHKSIRQLREQHLKLASLHTSISLSTSKSSKKIRPNEEVISEFLRSVYQAHAVLEKGQVGGIPSLDGSRSRKKATNCTAGPVEGPTTQRVHWIPYVHFGP